MSRRLRGWRPPNTGPNAIVQLNGPDLLRRSRDLRRNVPHASRAINLIATHTVGTGIVPRSLCSNKKVREALTQLWSDWTAVADSDGLLDFYGLQNLAVTEMVEAGEAFCRLRARFLSDGLPVPLQLQILPTEMVPLDYSTPNGTNAVAQGIERDAVGRRVAYWTYPQHPEEWIGGAATLDNLPRPIPAEDVAHLYNVTRAGQMRGLPWLASAITTLHQVAQYQDAELLRKQMAAAVVAFVKKSVEGGADPAEMAAQWGNVQEALGELPSVEMEPGTVQYLGPNEDIEFLTPGDVGNNYEAFLASHYRAIAAGTNTLYEELTGDWKNANDRTFRAALISFKRTVRQWQWGLVAAQFNVPIWNRFVGYAVSSGALKVPKSVGDADLYRVEWNPERWEYLNPVQDVQAIGEELSLGLTSRQAAIAARGDDIEVIDAQRQQDQEREQSLGIAFQAPGTIAAASAEPDAPADGHQPG
ncbi:phage portal protein [Roseomonas sp. NAR14]|uniref:Phage portal protein n=1 Tax=Roseomonas acroporae TaxID=2937791 RepID=A0A9X2BWC7_9PROT|nr:phage portal protein [Roseomonas acroporae]MCK8787648.1 phage portal protein [Roseomonas acroporae]